MMMYTFIVCFVCVRTNMKIILLDFYENIMMNGIIGARIHNGEATPNNLNKIKSTIIEFQNTLLRRTAAT